MKAQFYKDWGFAVKVPEYFKHEIDLYTWDKKPENALWVERGVYAREKMFNGCKVLDLCCGDGIYSYLFFSSIAQEIVAVDIDDSAIKYCIKNYSHPKIKYLNKDIILDDLPDLRYDIVVWNAAIEHFTIENMKKIFNKISKVTKKDFTLCGYTNQKSGEKAHPHHKYEFESKDELRQFLSDYFIDVEVIKTWYPQRVNLYFRCKNYKEF